VDRVAREPEQERKRANSLNNADREYRDTRRRLRLARVEAGWRSGRD
jgi:hypothetical protein